jgi:hypothetical protein
VKLKTFREIKKLPSFFKTDKENEFNFPIKVVINNIIIPIVIILNFFITTDYINLSHKFMNFEQICLDESAKLKLSLENKSALPQKYGFIMLPKEFKVLPNIETLLPGEKTDVDIIYESVDNYIGHREGEIVK